MSRSIQLRDHPDPPVPGVADKILDLVRSVNLVWRVGAVSAKIRQRGKVEGEGLGVCYVPVEYIHLGEAQ